MRKSTPEVEKPQSENMVNKKDKFVNSIPLRGKLFGYRMDWK